MANLYVLDVIANGDGGPNGYVHAIAIFDAVDLDVDRFATFDLVDVLLVVYLLVVAVYIATLLCCRCCDCSSPTLSVRCLEPILSM